MMAIGVNLFFAGQYWPSTPLHSLLEGAGVLLYFSLGTYLVLLVRSQLLTPRFLWAAASFFAMAVIAAFHGSVEPGNTFVGLHSVGVLVGGLIFAMIALPRPVHNQAWLRHLPWISLLFALLLSLTLLLTDQLFPAMLKDEGAFSETAIIFNSLGAVGFLIATLALILNPNGTLAHQVLAVLTLLFSISAVLFEYSTLWDATWWLWHFLRFIALSILLGYFFVCFYRQAEATRDQADKLEELAFRDSLTQLANRALFYQQLKTELKKAQRSQQTLALLFIDLDRFKNVNDSLGHDVGDELLIEVAQRLNQCLRQSDLLARMGGDEFTVILNGDQSAKTAGQVAQNIIDAITPSYQIQGHHITIGASIGIAFYPQDSQDLHSLMRLADTAMYQAKASGRNTYRFFQSPKS